MVFKSQRAFFRLWWGKTRVIGLRFPPKESQFGVCLKTIISAYMYSGYLFWSQFGLSWSQLKLHYRPRSRGDNTFGSVRLSVNALMAEPFDL